MTTYGVSGADAGRDFEVASACSLAEEIGARCAVYDMGMEIPDAALSA
jgi:hypothetical protein